jgi:uncharacterized protein YkwD
MYVDGFALRWRAVSLLFIFSLVTCTMLAEDGVLVLVVTDTRQHSFANLQMGTEGDAGSPQFTDQNGKARLRLAPNTKPGAMVTLQLGKTPNGLDLDFISPFNRRVRVPPFDNGPDNYDEVTLALHGDKETLETGSGMLAVNGSVNQAVAAQKKKPAPAHRSGHLVPFDYTTPRLMTVALNIAGRPKQSPVAAPTNEELREAAIAAAAQKYGFSVAEIKAAMVSWGGDPLIWKLILLTATIETGGSDPFPAIRATSKDIYFGVGSWSLGDCTLQPVLLKFQTRDQKRFAEIIGPDTKWLSNTLSGPCEASSQAILKRVVDDSGHLRPAWRARLRKLGYEHSFQRMQVDQMMLVMRSAQDATNTLGLQSEQALAFSYNVAEAHGANTIIRQRQNLSLDVAAFQQQIGRQPDEQEKLLMLANRVLQPAKDSGGNSMFTASFIARATLLSQGQGEVFGTHYNLEECGIGMQDVQTGADLPLNNDPTVLQQLRDGWIPSEGPPPAPRASQAGPPSVDGPAEPFDPAGAKQLLDLISQVRVKQKLQPLVVDPRLTQAACKHTALLAAHKTASHQFEGEAPPDVRLANQNLSADQLGENTAVGPDLLSAHKGLMNDPDHRDVVLNPNYNSIGVCVVKSGGQVFVTEDFAHLLN